MLLLKYDHSQKKKKKMDVKTNDPQRGILQMNQNRCRLYAAQWFPHVTETTPPPWNRRHQVILVVQNWQ